MDKDTLVELDEGNFAKNRAVTIQSMNLSTELIKENKERIYSKIFYALSLIFAIFLAVFVERMNCLLTIFLIDLILANLLWPAKMFYYRRRELARDHRKIIRKLEEFGIKIADLG